MKMSDFNPVQLRIGTKHELEHTSDHCVAVRIAMDHLAEDPEYYQKLKKLDSDATTRLLPAPKPAPTRRSETRYR